MLFYVYLYAGLCVVCTAIGIGLTVWSHYDLLLPGARTIRNFASLIDWKRVVKIFPFTPFLLIATIVIVLTEEED
ncbi:MAG: hypothetical protein ACK4S4_15995 [Pyrinomonadaceae bacterium]